MSLNHTAIISINYTTAQCHDTIPQRNWPYLYWCEIQRIELLDMDRNCKKLWKYYKKM